jgi:hypothetical protein
LGALHLRCRFCSSGGSSRVQGGTSFCSLRMKSRCVEILRYMYYTRWPRSSPACAGISWLIIFIFYSN